MVKLNITELQHYMFTKNHIMKLFDGAPNKKERNFDNHFDKNVEKKTEQVKEDDEFILPQHCDTLFWCFYIISCGLFEYTMLGNSTFKEEKSTKIQIVEELKNHKDLLKKNKWKKTEVENDLVSEKKISLKTFFCICAIKNINVVILKGRCLYLLENNPGADYELITENAYGYMLSQHKQSKKKKLIDAYMATFWLISEINKPLGPISSYKVGVLQDICKKLNISIVTDKGKKYNKKILYEMIKCKV